MRRRYQVILLKPEYGAGGYSWTPVCSKRFGTLESARRQCQRWMDKHPVYCSKYTYHQELAKAWDCRIADLKNGRTLACRNIEPPVRIELSVEERGVW